MATHADRKQLFLQAGRQIGTTELAKRYYEQDDESILPRSIASKAAFEKCHEVWMWRWVKSDQYRAASSGGSAGGAGVDFKMADIDRVSRRVPCLSKVAPATQKYHMEDVHRAGGVIGILSELDRAGLIDHDTRTVRTLRWAKHSSSGM